MKALRVLLPAPTLSALVLAITVPVTTVLLAPVSLFRDRRNGAAGTPSSLATRAASSEQAPPEVP